MSDRKSESLKTRREETSVRASSKSSAWKRAQLSKLRAEQAQRAADAAIRRARTQAQRAADDAEEEARALAQRAADQAEVDELAARLYAEERRETTSARRSAAARRPTMKEPGAGVQKRTRGAERMVHLHSAVVPDGRRSGCRARAAM